MEELQLTQSTVTELVQRAREAGLIDRTPSAEDARVVHLRVTARGEELLESAVLAHGRERRMLIELVAALGDEPG